VVATGRTFVVQGGTVLPLEGRKVVHDPGAVLVVDGCATQPPPLLQWWTPPATR